MPQFAIQRIALKLHHHIMDDQGRIYLWGPFLFASGIVIYCETSTAVTALALFLTCVGSLYFRRRPYLRFIFYIVSAGMLWTHGHACLRHTPFIPHALHFYRVDGKITQVHTYEKGQFFELTTQIGRIKLWDRYIHKDLKLYDDVKVIVNLFPPSTSQQFRGFDEQWYAFWNGHIATGKIIHVSEKSFKTPSFLYKWKHHIDRTQAQFRKPELGHLWSKLIRAEGIITHDMRKTFAQSGLSHVLAVSGLHMTIIVGLMLKTLQRIFILILPLRLHCFIAPLASFLSFQILCLYTWQCWSSLSARRAAFMSTMGLLSLALWKPYHFLFGCLWAGWIVLLINPEAIYSLSFQMSFMAVFLLAHEAEKERLFFRKKTFKEKRFYELKLTIKLTLVTTVYSTQLSDVHAIGLGIFSNILAIPYVTFVVMPLAFILYLTSLMGTASFYLICLNEWALQGIIEMGQIGAIATEYFHIEIPKPSLFTIVIFTTSCFWGIIWKGSWRRWNRWGLICTVCSLILPISQKNSSKMPYLIKKEPQIRALL